VRLCLVKKHRANIMIASHNQKSIENTIDLMREMKIDPTTGGVYFGQLLGMLLVPFWLIVLSCIPCLSPVSPLIPPEPLSPLLPTSSCLSPLA
jgi:hypothetical protein